MSGLELSEHDSLSKKLKRLTNLDKVLEIIGDELIKIEAINGYYFTLYDIEKKQLVLERLFYEEDFHGFEKITQKSIYSQVDNDVYNKIINNKEVLFFTSEDVKDLPALKNKFDFWRIKSAAYIPITDNTEAIGILALFNHYTELDTIDIEAGIELVNTHYKSIFRAWQYTRKKQYKEDILKSFERNEKVLSLSQIIMNLKSLNQIFGLILNEIFNVFNFDIGLILLYEENSLKCVSCKTANEKFNHILQELEKYLKTSEFTISPPDCTSSTCFLQKIHFFIPNIMQIKDLPMFEKDKKVIEILQTPYTGFVLPISFNDKPIGIINVYTLTGINDLNENDIKLLNKLGSFIGLSISNARLYSLVEQQKEELTSAKNEIENFNRISREINLANDFKTAYSIIIEYFQKNYGFEGNFLTLVNDNRSDYTFVTGKLPAGLQEIENEYIGSSLPLDLNGGGRVADCIINNKIRYYENIDTGSFDKVKNPVNKRFLITTKPQTILHIPMSIGEEVVGSFFLLSISKNIHLEENDIQAIKRFADQIAVFLKSSKLYDEVKNKSNELEIKDKLISEDLFLAKKIQTNVISRDYEKIDKLNITVYFEPMISVGGDIYDIYKLKDNYYRILIADATGHGVQAALITMILKTEYDKIKEIDALPNIILSIFNNVFINKYSVINVFFTCMIVDIDLNENKIYFSSAGHPDQMILSYEEKKVKLLKASGGMIGVLKNVEFKFVSEDFKPKDKLVLFTDGIYEEFNNQGEEFGENRFIELLNKNIDLDIEKQLKFIIVNITDWLNDSKVNDDITVIGIEYPGQNK